ncbi:NUDIX hydrolase [Streptomyces sp. NBC_00316]|uniref:NUDIX hydrolase n=1 Tax=Streptomyces sp. NBC_00316 TaxID=2975710 RepID=UPI002E2E5FA9|nr:NUDIX hydrolase [Streptomyces sp. NBC_00316]
MAVLPLLGGEVVLIEHYRHATRAWHWEIPRGGGIPGLISTDNSARTLQEKIGASARELIPLGKVHPDTGLLADAVLLYAARIDEVGDVPYGKGIRQARTVSFARAEAMARAGEITDVFTLAALMRARLAGLGR